MDSEPPQWGGRPLHIGADYQQIKHKNESVTVTFIPGGCVLVKRSVWEKIGLQDETLYMYGDERDFAINLSRYGYIECIIPEALAWHQHINKPGTIRRSNSSVYFGARNRSYITRKYFGLQLAIPEFIYCTARRLGLICLHTARKEPEKRKIDIIGIRGSWHGLTKRMHVPPPE